MMQKKAVAIHDISGFGRCSLTVALPLLSATGVQTAVIPTALLSTHTGGFENNTFRDLTADIEPIAAHWKRENLHFDAVYSGYLSSEAQVFSVISAIELIKSDDTLLLVDPVMGDGGKIYSGFSQSFPEFTLKLCKKADIITPNITEACLLTKTPFEESYDELFIAELLAKLYNLTKAKVVLTGVSFDERRIGAALLEEGEISYVFAEKSPDHYHSTGDIFASVLLGSILNGRSLKSAAQIAVNFTSLCIKQTAIDKTDKRYGVNFEKEIPNLIRFLEL